jgi:hypothetical protein
MTQKRFSGEEEVGLGDGKNACFGAAAAANHLNLVKWNLDLGIAGDDDATLMKMYNICNGIGIELDARRKRVATIPPKIS